MFLTKEEEKILDGEEGFAKKKAMELLVALGKIYKADKLIPISSVQVSGVSYHNLGEAGLEFLESLSDGKVSVITTLNPAGIDIERQELFDEKFVEDQKKVISVFQKMGVIPTCTCTPYLIGNTPQFGDHIAWAESSAIVFANSVIGARTNRESGPSAIAAALLGKTPNYGFHLDENRIPEMSIDVKAEIKNEADFGALGHAIGEKTKNKVLFIKGIAKASVDELKIFGASTATYSGTALFYIDNITPKSMNIIEPTEKITVEESDIRDSFEFLNDGGEIDFVSVGCPHASIDEIRKIAQLLEGRSVKKEFWITTARPTKHVAEKAGYVKIIEDAGAKIVCDTCLAVAPLKGRFKAIATNSAKGCFYGRGSNSFKTKFGTLEQCVNAAVNGSWDDK